MRQRTTHPLHICVVSSSFPLHEGHVQSPFLLYLARALSNQGVRVTVVCPFVQGCRPLGTIGPVRVHRFRYFWPNRLQTLTSRGGIPSNLQRSFFDKIQFVALVFSEFFAVLRFVRHHHCDLLHAQWSLPGLVSVAVKNITKIPVVVTERGAALHLAIRNRFMKRVLMYCLAHSDFVTANNQCQIKIMEGLGISRKKLAVVSNGVDSSLFRPLNKTLCRRQLRFTRDDPLLLFVGWLIERKGVAYLLHAVSQMVQDYPKLRLVVIGDGVLRKDLMRLSQDLRIRPHVLFRGSLPHREIARYMNAADLIVLPSLSEGRANVLQEALACATPVVATNVGDASSVVVDGTSGFLCRPKDVNDLREKIEFALGQQFRRRFSKNVESVRKEKLTSWDTCAQRYIAIYRKILNEA